MNKLYSIEDLQPMINEWAHSELGEIAQQLAGVMRENERLREVLKRISELKIQIEGGNGGGAYKGQPFTSAPLKFDFPNPCAKIAEEALDEN